MPELSIQPLTAEGLPGCLHFMGAAPDPWTPAALQTALADPNHRCFVAKQNGAAIACAVFLVIGGSADLSQLVTSPAHRRGGVARHLLRHALAQLRAQGVGRCLLEVRKSNRGAVALYESLGFKTLALRPAMYANPMEDGLLMALELEAGR